MAVIDSIGPPQGQSHRARHIRLSKSSWLWPRWPATPELGYGTSNVERVVTGKLHSPRMLTGFHVSGAQLSSQVLPPWLMLHGPLQKRNSLPQFLPRQVVCSQRAHKVYPRRFGYLTQRPDILLGTSTATVCISLDVAPSGKEFTFGL